MTRTARLAGLRELERRGYQRLLPDGVSADLVYYVRMARPLRLEYPGSVYHVLARGNERRDVFRVLGVSADLVYYEVLCWVLVELGSVLKSWWNWGRS